MREKVCGYNHETGDRMLPPLPPIFQNIQPEEYRDLVDCGCFRFTEAAKGTVLFRAGDRTREFGVLLSGEVHIESLDVWGNRVILHSVSAGQSFAETYAFCQVPLMVDVTAVRDSRVLLVHLGVLNAPASREKSWYPKLLHSLLVLSTGKNLAWSTRMFCISSKNIRTRVMTYLSGEARKHGSLEFTIPFDRQQMADYLNVERSALSKELGRMRKEGILDFRKNRFRLYHTES